MNSHPLVLSGWARHSVAKLWTRGCENLTLHSSFLSETHETAANMFCAKWSLNSWREILPSLVPTSKTGSAGFVTCSHAGQAKEGRKGLSTYRVARNCFLSQNKPHQLMTTQNSVIINLCKMPDTLKMEMRVKLYRVTKQLVSKVVLTSKKKLRFSVRSIY